MKTKSEILAPTDLSKCSENVLTYAFCFAGEIDATV